MKPNDSKNESCNTNSMDTDCVYLRTLAGLENIISKLSSDQDDQTISPSVRTLNYGMARYRSRKLKDKARYFYPHTLASSETIESIKGVNLPVQTIIYGSAKGRKKNLDKPSTSRIASAHVASAKSENSSLVKSWSEEVFREELWEYLRNLIDILGGIKPARKVIIGLLSAFLDIEHHNIEMSFVRKLLEEFISEELSSSLNQPMTNNEQSNTSFYYIRVAEAKLHVRESLEHLLRETEPKSNYKEEEKDIDYLNNQAKQYDAMKDELLKMHCGEYVLFEDGHVLEHSVDEQELVLHAYQKYGMKVMFIEFVSSEERVPLRTFTPISSYRK